MPLICVRTMVLGSGVPVDSMIVPLTVKPSFARLRVRGSIRNVAVIEPVTTVVPSVSELLAGTGSVVADVTVAVLLIPPPAAGAVTLIVMAGAAPAARVARVQVTTPETWLQVQPVPVALVKTTPAGSEIGRASCRERVESTEVG